MKSLANAVISFISLFFRAFGMRACRFYPSCSCYAHEAFAKYGFLKAGFLSVKRIFKCQPFSAGGYDPLT